MVWVAKTRLMSYLRARLKTEVYLNYGGRCEADYRSTVVVVNETLDT
jgi:hypothetical protein